MPLLMPRKLEVALEPAFHRAARLIVHYSRELPRLSSSNHVATDGRERISRNLTNKKIKECMPAKAAKFAAVLGGLGALFGFLAITATATDARVLTEKLGQDTSPAKESSSKAFGADVNALCSDAKNRFEGAASVKEQVKEVIRISSQARESAQAGQYKQALDCYTAIIKQYPGLAISNYARIGRALMLYQTGNTSEAILELQDLEVSLRGYAEIHAALASILYSERPSEISYAEEQFDLASEFDSRYIDVRWVEKEKHWPPAMLRALDKFAALK